MFVRQPWFIGTMGAVAWVILLVVVLLLYRQRRHRKKPKKALTSNGRFFFPLHGNIFYFCTFHVQQNYSEEHRDMMSILIKGGRGI